MRPVKELSERGPVEIIGLRIPGAERIAKQRAQDLFHCPLGLLFRRAIASIRIVRDLEYMLAERAFAPFLCLPGSPRHRCARQGNVPRFFPDPPGHGQQHIIDKLEGRTIEWAREKKRVVHQTTPFHWEACTRTPVPGPSADGSALKTCTRTRNPLFFWSVSGLILLHFRCQTDATWYGGISQEEIDQDMTDAGNNKC